MKRFFTLLLLFIAFTSAKANLVNPNIAREVGAKFLHASALLKSDDPALLHLVATYHTSRNEAAFYVFNTSNGFVIVSADDRALPILGYSDESVFTVDDVPVQMEDYLQQFVNQIQYVIDNVAVADATTAHQWEMVRTTGCLTEEREVSAVTPLLSDYWGQGCYYNNLCPTDPNATNNCGHVLTGCVATSFAQILHYWGYPATGTGSHTYTPSGYPQQTANFGATTYQWSNMPNSLSSASTSAQINAVATLMWHCGVAVEMNYGANGSSASSASIAPAIVSYFNYSNDLSIINRNNYSAAQWLNLIKGSLNLGRPVHYRGTDDNGGSGHAFVCDGYDNNNYLHFNWGWSGYCNNYFADGALNPDVYAFNTDVKAIINIHPNTPSYEINISATPSNAGTVSFGNKGEKSATLYNFEDGSMMGWTSLDADGDGYGWVSSTDPSQYHNSGVNLAGTGHGSSQAYVISGSWSNSAGIALTPNNYLVAPTKGEYGQIKFYACTQDAQYAAEHFGVAVSTTTATASAFTTIQEWTLTAKGERYAGPRGSREQGNWYEFTADLSAYAGQEIWVAIRHFNCTDQFILNVDDITLLTAGSATYYQGESCTVIANANSGYTFNSWKENGSVVSTSASYTFTVNGNRTLVANFSAGQTQQYTVNISANPTNGGNVAFNNGSSGEEITYDFEDLSMMNWTSLDADNDGYGWVSSANPSQYHNSGVNLAGTGHNASQGYVISGSWSNPAGVALTPDNYLVSPSKGNYSHIRFYACSQDAQYAAEHFGVAVSTTTATASAFTTIQEWTLTAKGERYAGPRGSRDQGNWYEFTADLSAYTGQEIWVALRHFNCTDQFILNVDDITLTTYNGGSASSSATFVQGQSCSVTAMPSNDYTFSNWTVNGNVVSTSANYTFIVNGNRNLVANFTPSAPQPQQYTVSVSANPSQGGTVSGGGLITAGQSCTVTATPNNDYTFSNWTENGNVVSTSASYTFAVNGDRTLVANFTPSSPQPQQYTISVSANPSEGGIVSGGGLITAGQSCIVTATPNNGYNFSNWTENGNVVSTSASYTFTVNGDRTLVANFTLQSYTITATADPIEGGQVSGGNTYTIGAVCSLSATPNTGYDFVNWTKNGNVVSANSSFSFNVTENADYVAHFMLQTFTVIATADPVEGGVIQIEGDSYYGATVTITVLLNEEYSFLNWTENGDIVSEDQTYEFILQDNRNLVANLYSTVGVDEKALAVKIYPNPVYEKLILETSEAINSIEIYNAMGILVYRQKENSGQLEIQTGQLTSGTYLIRLTTDDTVIIKRFVKE